MTYHPAEPQAGLAGGAQGDIGGWDVRWRLQGLDLPRGLTGRTGAHDVNLPHPEPGGRRIIERWTGLIEMIWRLDYLRLDYMKL